MTAPEHRYAWTATVGEKGQIVIPKQAREVFQIRPGDTLLLLGDEKRGIAI
ncbi:MAG: AbrB/MazE/SpoVT family DNA-binding domain-containing protein, partial [Eubacteriales bacterium]|nr:AbrB/MazE/SpoVT family DNA-binding domain-containing protein [Eubacteriales bacterium]